MITTVLSGILIFSGIFLCFTSVLGILRLPDVYTRIHAAGISDTYGIGLVIGGLILQTGFSLISIKLIFIILLMWYTSPLSSHSLLKAAYQSKLFPELKEEDSKSSS